MSGEAGACPRRTFCKACIGCLGAGSVGAVAYPVFTFMYFPQRLGADKPVEVPLADLPPGQAHYAQVRGQLVVMLVDETGPRVLSAACTHLGCSVIWDAADAVFRCPCHGAIFDATGQVVSGPVNVPLRQIPFNVENGLIIVS